MKEALRVGRTEIDTILLDGAQWVTASVQKLELDEQNNIVATRVREGRITRRIEKVATQMVDIVDPVTGKAYAISLAGVGEAIKSFLVAWMIEDNPGYRYDEAIRLVVKDDTSR